MNQPEKKLCHIRVEDARGTSLEIALFMADTQAIDYARDLISVWDYQYSGKADRVLINNTPVVIPPPFSKTGEHHE